MHNHCKLSAARSLELRLDTIGDSGADFSVASVHAPCTWHVQRARGVSTPCYLRRCRGTGSRFGFGQVLYPLLGTGI